MAYEFFLLPLSSFHLFVYPFNSFFNGYTYFIPFSYMPSCKFYCCINNCFCNTKINMYSSTLYFSFQ